MTSARAASSSATRLSRGGVDRVRRNSTLSSAELDELETSATHREDETPLVRERPVGCVSGRSGVRHSSGLCLSRRLHRPLRHFFPRRAMMSGERLLLANARLLNGSSDLWHVTVQNGRVSSVSAASAEPPHDQRVDLAGRVLCPGLCDNHVRLERVNGSLRRPGPLYDLDGQPAASLARRPDLARRGTRGRRTSAGRARGRAPRRSAERLRAAARVVD